LENILVVTDHFSRYAQAFPTSNQTAKTTARVLWEKFFVHYGFPERLHSYQGANFTSKLIAELCALAAIRQSRTTPFHAMGNGMTERFNPTLLQMLGTLDDDRKSDWKSYVAPMCHAYNVTIHSSTGFSPYYIMFVRHPKLAIDSLLGVNVDDLHAKTQHEYTRKLHDRLHHAYKKAREKALGTSEQQKAHYDVKALASKLNAGNLVLVRNVTQRVKQKIGDRWEEDPYIIISQPNHEIPVYDVKRDSPTARKVRRLHRNVLLPLRLVRDSAPKYVILQRRHGIDVNDDRPELRRSERIRRQTSRPTYTV